MHGMTMKLSKLRDNLYGLVHAALLKVENGNRHIHIDGWRHRRVPTPGELDTVVRDAETLEERGLLSETWEPDAVEIDGAPKTRPSSSSSTLSSVLSKTVKTPTSSQPFELLARVAPHAKTSRQRAASSSGPDNNCAVNDRETCCWYIVNK